MRQVEKPSGAGGALGSESKISKSLDAFVSLARLLSCL